MLILICVITAWLHSFNRGLSLWKCENGQLSSETGSKCQCKNQGKNIYSFSFLIIKWILPSIQSGHSTTAASWFFGLNLIFLSRLPKKFWRSSVVFWLFRAFHSDKPLSVGLSIYCRIQLILRDHPEALPDFLYCLGPWFHPQPHISSCGNTDLHSSHCIYPILNKLSHVVRLRDKSVRCLGCKFLGITQRWHVPNISA